MEEGIQHKINQKQKLRLSWGGIILCLALLLFTTTTSEYTNDGVVSVSIDQSMFFGTNFSNSSGASWQNEGELYFQKDLLNNGSFSCGSCSSGVNYFNDADQIAQTLSGSQPVEMRDIVLNNNGNLEVETELQVRNSLEFIKGDIITDRTAPSQFVHFEDNATHSGANNNRHINGYVGKSGDDSFVFPVGDGTTYHPLHISASNPSDFFKVAYVSNASGNALFPNGTTFRADTSVGSIQTVHSQEFWLVEGNNNAVITLTWNSSNSLNSLLTDVSELLVSGWNGEVWVDLGQNNLSGDVNTGSISSNSINPNDYQAYTFARATSTTFPLEWLDVALETQAEDAILSWSTAWELGTDNFQILRSEQAQDGFEVLGEVQASGNSSEVSQYSFIDRKALDLHKQKLFYRIKQIDLDGKFSYSPTIELSQNLDRRSFRFAFFPNPARDYLTIEPNASQGSLLLFSLINMQGQILLREEILADRQHRISLQNIPEGSYLIRLENEAHIETKSMLKR